MGPVDHEDEPATADAGTPQPAAADTGPAQPAAAELLSRLALIEGQPLEGRADAYVQLHDEFLRRLESADEPADP